MRPRRRVWTTGALLMIASALVVSPVFSTPFSGDDAFNSYLDGWQLAHHASLWQLFCAEFQEWDLGRGRFIPLLQVLNVLQFHFEHEAPPLKVLQMIAIAIDVGLLFAAALEIGGTLTTAVAASFLAIFTLSTRSWYDAIAQYNLHLPLGTAFGLGALWFVFRALRRRSRADYWIAVAAFGIATLTYEIFVPLIGPIAFAILKSDGSRIRRLRLLLPFLLLIAAEGCAVFAIRHAVPQTSNSSYVPRLFTSAYVPTVWRQLTGALPFNYIIVDPQYIFRNHGTWWTHLSLAGIASALTAGSGVILLCFKPLASRARSGDVAMFAIAGGTLALGPALLLATSPFYQNTVRAGLPYIPSYAQGFGFALLLAPLLRPLLNSKQSMPAMLVMSAAAAFACAEMHSANALVMQSFTSWGAPRQTIVDGLTRGAADSIPNSATVFLDDSYVVNTLFEEGSLWNNVWFYRLFGGKVWRTLPLSAETNNREGGGWEIRTTVGDGVRGVLVVQRIAQSVGSAPVLQDAMIAERDALDSSRPLLIGSGFSARDFNTVMSTRGSKLFRFRPRCQLLPTSALIADSPSIIAVNYDQGFSVAEHDAGFAFRWAGRRATMTLLNATRERVAVRVVAMVGTVGGARGSVSVASPGSRVEIPLSSQAAPLRLVATVPSETPVHVHFLANAPNVALPGDARDLRFRISGVTTTDASGCAASDAASPPRPLL